MAADVQVVEREVWEGRVPAVITLARDELTTLEQPRELYVCARQTSAAEAKKARHLLTRRRVAPGALVAQLMLPRQGYLPYAATREVYDHFGAHAPPCPDEVWFECDGAPLRWYEPCGASPHFPPCPDAQPRCHVTCLSDYVAKQGACHVHYLMCTPRLRRDAHHPALA